ncbi:MAG: N-6 DNA methylase [Nitrospiraceae bacterium]|nr:N-6 DNA methylase [Nitrospiraceae bacterium]
MTRVLGGVNWHQVSKDDPEAWLYFYELFLQQYDVSLRKKTGSYYTPPGVVTAMVGLVDQALRSPTRFNLLRGVAANAITIADPAVGTGTFMLGVIKRIAEIIDADEGEGARPAAIAEALNRIVGFEMQFGPFAVAQLRLFAEIAELSTPPDDDSSEPREPLADASNLRLFVTDTLADPDEEAAWIPVNLAGLGESQKAANAVKRKEAITVVIGNPPYKEKAKGLGGWVEDRGRALRAPLDDWQPPADWGVGAHAKHLRNLYVYFWRWAAWKVFGGDPYRTGTDKADAKWTERRGVICFITVAGFLNGPGFQKMRAELRRDADEIFVIDCSPEGHQPKVSSRIFEGVQQPVCIVMALRRSPEKGEQLAKVWHRSLEEAPRDAKMAELNAIRLDDGGWVEAPEELRAPFLPAGDAAWVSYPALDDLFTYNGSGVMAGRTWVIAPDAKTLKDRWARLRDEPDLAEKAKLFHPHMNGDRTATKVVREVLTGHPHPPHSVQNDKGDCAPPVRYAFRSFDRQWIIPDNRLINRGNPLLWQTRSERQVYLTVPHDRTPTCGPSLTIAGLLPDLHHYNGRGGRVFPLWADIGAAVPNMPDGLLAELALQFGHLVSSEDLFAYLAAVAANPAYTERFRKQLKQPGLRIPITADRKVFAEAVAWVETSFGCTPSASVSQTGARLDRRAWMAKNPASQPAEPCRKPWRRCPATSTMMPLPAA